ncbi:MFS transporter [Neobacillus sp. MER 74]|uniref:MFS transporter n=1 Tax=Neobacillus sp. MER 74 TaxID=2939566 RepID=UPI00203EE510|nr:MFS transporter [Neobacillus sp. MER 74]MCM3118627.1 MFS transporter [Neobacillus sp. MER 74]
MEVVASAKSQEKTVEVGTFFEDMPFTKKHRFVGVALFMAFVIEAWEMMIIIMISGAIAAEFSLTPVQVGSLIGAIFLGMIPGTYVWGIVGDKIGRKKTIIYSLLLYGVVSAVSAFSPNYETLYTLRLLSGFSLGGVLACIFPYYEEMLPVKQRGKAAVFLSAGWPIGTLIALGITSLLMNLDGVLGGWRAIIFISSLAGFWAFVIRKIPESPYWLAGKGRTDEAKQIISELSEGKTVVSQGTELYVSKVKQGSIFEIFKTKMIKTTALQTIVNFCFSFGYWGLYTWIPTLLQQKGLSMGQSLGFVALSAVAQIPGYIVAAHLTSKYGRKKVMFAFVLFASIFGFAFAYSSSVFQLYAFNFALGFFSLGAWGVWNTWFGEIYPTNVRGVGYSWGVGGQRWANTVAPSLIGFVIGLGWVFGATVSFIQVFMVITLITILFIRETEGEILH